MKSLFPITVAVACAAFVVAGCAVSAQKSGTMKEADRKGGFMGLATLADVEVSTAKAFTGKQRVVIGGFKVGFNDSKKVSRKAGTGFGGNATALIELQGVSESDKQKIADQAYQDFVAELKAQGYTVEDRSVWTGYKDYSKIKQYDFPYTVDKSGLFSSYGKGQVFSPAAIGGTQPLFAGEIEGKSGGFGHSNPAAVAAEFGKATGISVLNVIYIIDFAGEAGSGGRWSSTASVKVGQLLSVDRGVIGITSDWGGTFSSGVGSLNLGQPVSSDKEFATIEDITSGGEQAVRVATNLFSAVTGGGTSQERKYIYHAKPDQYRTAAIDALDRASELFVKKMVELR